MASYSARTHVPKDDRKGKKIIREAEIEPALNTVSSETGNRTPALSALLTQRAHESDC